MREAPMRVVVLSVWISVVAAACPGCGGADNSSVPVKRITLDSGEFGTLDRALGIPKFSGEFELTRPITKFGLTTELYQNGRKVDELRSARISTEKANRSLPPGTGEFAVHLIDLDDLPLEGKTEHVRFSTQVRFGGSMTYGPDDVPKSQFAVDDHPVNGFSFPPQAAQGDRIPLCCLIANQRGYMLGRTVEEAVANNSDAQIAVLILEVDWME